jgi:predicted Zn-dependent protease
VLRSALFFLLIAHLAWSAQNSAPNPAAKPAAASAATSVTPPVPAQVLDAEASIAKSDWKSAQALLDSWLAAHPADSRALFDAAYVADAQNRMDDAAALYRRAIDANPQSFEAHLSLGLLLAHQNKLDGARAEIALATTLDPGDGGPAIKARAWRALAQIDRNTDPTEASNDLLQALKLTPETPADSLLAANLADQSGEHDAAERAYRRILSTDPDSAAANSGLAQILIGRKQYPEAETLLRAALAKSPDDPTLTGQLAAVLAAQDKAEALPLIQKLHDAHPDNAAINRILAEVLADAGDAVGSDHLYIGLLKATPNDPDLLIGHGQNLTRQLKYTEALAAFDKATQIDPANPDGWSGLAFAASKTSQPSVTLHALTMRSKYLPDIPSTYFLWAISYDSLHQTKAAATYYHHFLDSAAGKYPDQEWQARQRLKVLER